jgi:hypothetical protein
VDGAGRASLASLAGNLLGKFRHEISDEGRRRYHEADPLSPNARKKAAPAEAEQAAAAFQVGANGSRAIVKFLFGEKSTHDEKP